MSFLKRLFGGTRDQPQRPPPPPADPLAQDRHNAALYDRAGHPQDWANAQQILANNLVAAAATEQPPRARALYAEAIDILGEALEATGPDANLAFRASMLKLRGDAARRRADFQEGDAKGRALADAANWLGQAIDLCPPQTNLQLWTDAQFFRGDALLTLGQMKGGAQGLAWLDESVACFDAVDQHHRITTGCPHAIALFNRAVVLENRAEATDRPAASRYYQLALESLDAAKANPDFGPQLTDYEARRAKLKSAMATLP